MHKSLINTLRFNDFNRSKSNDKGINRKKYLIIAFKIFIEPFKIKIIFLIKEKN